MDLNTNSDKETGMGMNTNLFIWLFTELTHGISARFQYQILFGLQTLELHGYTSMKIMKLECDKLSASLYLYLQQKIINKYAHRHKSYIEQTSQRHFLHR